MIINISKDFIFQLNQTAFVIIADLTKWDKALLILLLLTSFTIIH